MTYTIIGYAGRGLISRLIRWVARSRLSHVAIGTTLHGIPVILHCTVGGVQLTLRRAYEWTSLRVIEFNAEDCHSLYDLERGVKEIGDRYDYGSLLGRGALILSWRWLRLRLRHPKSTPHAMVCSEFVARVARLPVDPETSSPQDVLRACRRLGLQEIQGP
jgi:hypothetical protein